MKKLTTFDEYLAQLSFILKGIPEDERNLHLTEIRDHFLELKEEKSTEDEEAILQAFVRPEKIGAEILEDYKEKENVQFEQPDFGFTIATICTVTPFATMALPIFLGYYDGGVQLAFIIKLLLGTIFTFGYYKNKLNEKRINILRTMGRFMIFLLCLPFGFYAFSIANTGEIVLFSSVYLVIYLMVWSIYYFALRRYYVKAVH
ncbi:hypothetical protein [Bacillus sp. JCM 19034]|uniref:HAAS signaling domain-containing protein n=1 Tax=Bacillus sp. JCM 19034 TaxID=1481928 RepID=UPI000781CAB1|nr:hypothetical protein [Bacillus sp. JCM 19034]